MREFILSESVNVHVTGWVVPITANTWVLAKDRIGYSVRPFRFGSGRLFPVSKVVAYAAVRGETVNLHY